MSNNEPSMDKIDDYTGNESKEKRSTINKVIILCLVVGAILAGLKLFYNNPGDYVGTPENPGINTAR
ncbi:MAG: hypothetical protein HY307_00215 [Arcobacter sp.]|nr:hypothetical protein [Arcobacter sp.]